MNLRVRLGRVEAQFLRNKITEDQEMLLSMLHTDTAIWLREKFRKGEYLCANDVEKILLDLPRECAAAVRAKLLE